MNKLLKNILFLSLPSIMASLLFFEVVARVTWDEKRGVPAFRMLHAKRGCSLFTNYRGNIQEN